MLYNNINVNKHIISNCHRSDIALCMARLAINPRYFCLSICLYYTAFRGHGLSELLPYANICNNFPVPLRDNAWCIQIPIYTGIMMTSSNGNIFRVTDHLCGEFTGPGDFPTKRPVTRSFDVFFDMRPNKRFGWVNTGEAGDLRRHRAHYDVIVMWNMFSMEHILLYFASCYIRNVVFDRNTVCSLRLIFSVLSQC